MEFLGLIIISKKATEMSRYVLIARWLALNGLFYSLIARYLTF